MSNHYDFIIIGGGSAGYAAARTAREHRERVAIIDNSDTLGGLCILKGCMPSKTLIYSAEVLHLAQQGTSFGLNIPTAKVDMPGLHQRKVDTIKAFAEYRQEQLENERFTLIRQAAAFSGDKEITLEDGTRLSADFFVIATGSKVATPAVPGLKETPFWTSDDILNLKEKPESVIVLGGGVVACELAQFLHRIGTRVTQIQRSPHLLSNLSPEAASVVANAFRAEGMELYTGTRIERITSVDQGVEVTFQHEGQQHTVMARHLFNALGRSPHTDGLNLEAAKVGISSSGHIACNGWQQTVNPAIYAAGDVAGPHEIVHVAIMQGETAVRHALGMEPSPVSYRDLLIAVFTDPQVAHVGLSEKQMAEEGIEFVTADYPFDDHGKSILMEARYGYVKTWVDVRTGQLLAAECVGKDASELIHALAVAVTLKANIADLLKVHWYHPTLSEIWSYPLEECLESLATR